jgi:hypothetical protein
MGFLREFADPLVTGHGTYQGEAMLSMLDIELEILICFLRCVCLLLQYLIQSCARGFKSVPGKSGRYLGPLKLVPTTPAE